MFILSSLIFLNLFVDARNLASIEDIKSAKDVSTFIEAELNALEKDTNPKSRLKKFIELQKKIQEQEEQAINNLNKDARNKKINESLVSAWDKYNGSFQYFSWSNQDLAPDDLTCSEYMSVIRLYYNIPANASHAEAAKKAPTEMRLWKILCTDLTSW